jgi:hypothetical protein
MRRYRKSLPTPAFSSSVCALVAIKGMLICGETFPQKLIEKRPREGVGKAVRFRVRQRDHAGACVSKSRKP